MYYIYYMYVSYKGIHHKEKRLFITRINLNRYTLHLFESSSRSNPPGAGKKRARQRNGRMQILVRIHKTFNFSDYERVESFEYAIRVYIIQL